MIDKSIIAKIKKCLALSASSNEHEAEAALRQARKLMEAHGVTEQDVEASMAEERLAKSGAKRTPPAWESALAVSIADAFGCKVIFIAHWSSPGEWSYIGCGVAPEIAQYAFTVLARQIRRARAEHIKKALKRCKASTKTRRADLYCDGWVYSVCGKITAFAGTVQQTAAINAYVQQRFPALKSMDPSDRNAGRSLKEHELRDFDSGIRSGKDAQLNRGMDGMSKPLAIGIQS